MKTAYSLKSFSPPTLFILLILCMLLVQHVTGQEKFWVPSDPPGAHYKIDARINLPNNIIEGKETIILDNNSSRPISLLGVDWSINNYRSIEISISGKSLPLLNSAKKPPIPPPLLYVLPKPVKPGSRVKLEVKFSGGGFPGGDKKEIKFQLSIKFPIAENLIGKRDSLHFAYTHLSFWQAYDQDGSSPFRETVHEPEVFMSFESDWEFLGLDNRIVQFGIVHQSNGRDGELSRSWNRVYMDFILL